MRRFRSLFWRVVALLILAAGVVALWVRFTQGPGAAASQRGLWFGFNVLCVGGLGAGGFAVAAAYYLLRLKWLRCAARPAGLTAFLGYLSVIASLMIEPGRPRELWQPACWCLILSVTLLALEFVAAAGEKRGWAGTVKVVHGAIVLVAGCGLVFSLLDQSSLGNLFLKVGARLHPLWHSPFLPLFFFLSAVAAGFAMVIFVNEMGERAFGRAVELALWQRAARSMAVFLVIFLGLRFWDLAQRGSLTSAFVFAGPGSLEAYLFWMEVALLAFPMVSVWQPSRSARPQALFSSAVMVIAGFLANRLNVSITALEASAGVRYFPSWMEWAVALAIVTVDFVVFAIAARYLPVFLGCVAGIESAPRWWTAAD